MKPIKKSGESTRDLLLTNAIELVQQRGFHGFSYRDLSELVGVRAASIHHHFPTKSDLGRAIVEQHRQDNEAFFARIDAGEKTSRQRLEDYFATYCRCYGDGKNMCLGGMMAIDTPLLADEVVQAIQACYADHERWLTRVLNQGRKSGEFQFEETPAAIAKTLFDALEGSLLASRLFRNPRRLDATLQILLDKLLR